MVDDLALFFSKYSDFSVLAFNYALYLDKNGHQERLASMMDMLGPKYGLNLCYCNWETNNPQMNAHFLWKCIGIILLLYYLKTDPYAISTNFNP